VYTSEHLSLAALEMLAHLPPELRLDVPPLAAAAIEFPSGLEESIAREDLPDDPEGLTAWCRERGDAWLRSGAALCLIAPSTIVPQERNVMLNPAHPDMRTVKVIALERFRFDERVLAKRS